MRRLQRKKGFTMVELLAVIVLLGLLTAISVSTIQSVIRRAKDQYYVSQEENLAAAGRNYMEKNRQYLPKVTGQKTTVDADVLIESKYISSLVDYNKNKCRTDKSYVQVIKGENDFYYDSYIECDKYKTNLKQLEGNFKGFDVTFSGGVNDAKAKLTLQEDKYEIASYQYIITNIDFHKVVYTSENYEERGKKSLITRTISLKDHTPGHLKVVIRATNIGGAEYIFSKEWDYSDDGSKMKCGDSSGVRVWTSGDRTITIPCIDDTAKIGCAKAVFTKKFSSSMKMGIITITDKNGIRRDCEVPVYVDKDAPTVTTSSVSASSNNLSFQLKDNLSLAAYAVTESSTVPTNWTTISGSDVKSFDKTLTKADGTYYVHAKDSAGNTTYAKQVVQTIEKPTVTLKADGKNLSKADGTWINKDVTMHLSVVSNFNISKWQYSHDGVNWSDDFSANPNGWKASYSNNKKNANFTISWDGSWNFYVRAVDVNGKISPKSDKFWIGRDTVKPDCKVTVTGGHLASDKWSFLYDTDIEAKLTTYTDDRSGVKYYDIVPGYTSCVLEDNWRQFCPEYTVEKTTNKNTYAKFVNDDTGMFWAYVIDNAGNGKKCWAYVQKDTLPPYAPHIKYFRNKENATVLEEKCTGDCSEPAWERGDFQLYYKVKCPCGKTCKIEYSVPWSADRPNNNAVANLHTVREPSDCSGVCGSSQFTYGEWYSVDDAGHVGSTFKMTIEWVS